MADDEQFWEDFWAQHGVPYKDTPMGKKQKRRQAALKEQRLRRLDERLTVNARLEVSAFRRLMLSEGVQNKSDVA